MSSVLSGIRLYDYRGNYRVMPPMDVNQSFTTPQTQLSNSFSVNAATSIADLDRYMEMRLSVDGNGQMVQAPTPSMQALMNFGSQTYRLNSNTTYEGATKDYQSRMASFAISDQNFNDLMQLPQFSIFNGTLGVTAVRNPDGTHDVKLEPGTKDSRGGTPINAAGFPDRATITEGAVPLLGSQLPPTPADPNAPIFLQNQKTGIKAIGRENRLELPGTPLKSAPVKVSFTPEVPAYEPSLDAATNPLLQKLLRLQPREVDVPVFGPDAKISADSAKKIGAVNGSFGVEYSAEFRDNLAVYKERMAQQAQEVTPQKVAQMRDGRMPLASQYPVESAAPQNPFLNQSSSGFPQMAASTDTTDKKSSGGYIPFRMGQDSQGSNQQGYQQPPRKPLYAIA